MSYFSIFKCQQILKEVGGQLTIESLKVSYRDVRSGELGGKGGHWHSGDMTVPPLKSVINLHFFKTKHVACTYEVQVKNL